MNKLTNTLNVLNNIKWKIFQLHSHCRGRSWHLDLADVRLAEVTPEVPETRVHSIHADAVGLLRVIAVGGEFIIKQRETGTDCVENEYSQVTGN